MHRNGATPNGTVNDHIRVVVADDHAVVRSGLEFFFSTTSDIRVIGHAEDGEHALALCIELHPDVVLMDLVMPHMDGIAATDAIRAGCPNTQVIVLSGFQEETLVQRVLKAGAISYLLKDTGGNDLADAVRAASIGRSILAPQVTKAVINMVTRPPEMGCDLTRRECEVLALMAEGLTNPEIADKIIVSANTVRYHVRNILAKLHVTNRTAAVRYALQHQLVPQAATEIYACSPTKSAPNTQPKSGVAPAPA